MRVRRHRQARRYTLAHPCRDPRGRAHHAAARQREAGAGTSRRSTAAGSRRGSTACRSRRRSRTARCCRCAASSIASCIGRGVRGTVWIETPRRRRAAALRRRRAPHICRAGSAIISSARPSAISKAASRRAAQELGVTIRRVSVRDQSSRWGSCSTTGVLSYSWRLILAPPFVLDYLAAHEVAHLIEMNHSRRFWRLVDGICPRHAPRQSLARRPRHRSAPLRLRLKRRTIIRAEPLASCCVPATFALTLLLAALSAIGPLTTDMYLPSLPDIAQPARRLDRAGAAHDFRLSGRLCGRADFLWPGVRSAWPQAGADGGARALLRGEPGVRAVAPRSKC